MCLGIIVKLKRLKFEYLEEEQQSSTRSLERDGVGILCMWLLKIQTFNNPR